MHFTEKCMNGQIKSKHSFQTTGLIGEMQIKTTMR